jgi:hypothetical protein
VSSKLNGTNATKITEECRLGTERNQHRYSLDTAVTLTTNQNEKFIEEQLYFE